jgi:hypothetical protein
MAPRHSVLLALAVSVASSCSDEPPVGLPDTVEVTTTDTLLATSNVYAGSRGLVIDTRDLFLKGYEALAVELSFPDYPRLDTELEVDPVTNLAVFVVENDSLSDAEVEAFDGGLIDTEIVVYGAPLVVTAAAAPGLARVPAGSVPLARSSTPRSVDSSNRPVKLDNESLPELPPPLEIAEGVPYLLVVDGSNGAVTRPDQGGNGFTTMDGFISTSWPYLGGSGVPNYLARDTLPGGIPRERQYFYFTPVAGQPDTYTIQSFSAPDLGTYLVPWQYQADSDSIVQVRGAGESPLPAEGPGTFRLVREANERVRIQYTGNDLYLAEPSRSGSQSWTMDPIGVRFRLIPPELDFISENLGTSFNQPIIPPARIALGTESTIRNCSAATISEVIGRTETRTITRSSATSTSFQVVSDSSETFVNDVGIDVQVRYKSGDAYDRFTSGFSIGGGASFNHEWEDTYTTSSVIDTTRVSQSDTTETVQVSRSRQIEVPAYAAVSIVDWLRTVEDVDIPWTQTLRLRAINRKTGEFVSGPELLSILRANRTTAVPLTVSPTSIDITLRGVTRADSFYQTETNIIQLPKACR